MILTWRKCIECGRRWAESECLLMDDPQAPFGVERLCPQCEGLTLAQFSFWIWGISILLAGTIGLTLGRLLSRM